MPERYDLGPLSQLSMPSETKARKLSNLQRQQAMQINAAQEQRAAALAPHQLEASRLGNLATQQNIAASKQNIATAQQQNKVKLAEAYQKVGDLASQTWYAVKRKYGDDPEALNMHRRNLVGSVTNVMSKLPGGTQAAEKFKAKVAEDPSFLDTMAAQYDASQSAKRGAIQPKVDKITRPFFDPVTQKYYETGSRITTPDGTVVNVPPKGAKGASTVDELLSVQRSLAESKGKKDYEILANQWRDTTKGLPQRREKVMKEIGTLEQAKTALENMPTGMGAETALATAKIASWITGGEVKNDDFVAQAEALRSLTQDFVALRIADTKGAVSEAEFNTFIKSVPSLLMSKKGNTWVLAKMEQMARFEAEYLNALDRIDRMGGTVEDKRQALSEFQDDRFARLDAFGAELKAGAEALTKQIGGESATVSTLFKAMTGGVMQKPAAAQATQSPQRNAKGALGSLRERYPRGGSQ